MEVGATSLVTRNCEQAPRSAETEGIDFLKMAPPTLPQKDDDDSPGTTTTTTAAGEPSGPSSSYLSRSAAAAAAPAPVSPDVQVNEPSSAGSTPSPAKAAFTPTRDPSAGPPGPRTPSDTPSPRVAGGGEGGLSPRFALRFVSSPARSGVGGGEGGVDPLWHDGAGSTVEASTATAVVPLGVEDSPMMFDLVGVSPRATAPSTPSTIGVGSSRGQPLSSARREESSDSESSDPGVADLPRGGIRTNGTTAAIDDLNLPSLGIKPPAPHGSTAAANLPIRPHPQQAPSLEASHRPPRPGSSNRSLPQGFDPSMPIQQSQGRQGDQALDEGSRNGAHHHGTIRGSVQKMRSLLRRPRSADEQDGRPLDTSLEVTKSMESMSLSGGAGRSRTLSLDEDATTNWESGAMAGVPQSTLNMQSSNNPGVAVESAKLPEDDSEKHLHSPGGIGHGHRRSHRHRQLQDVDSCWPEDPPLPHLHRPPKITRLGVISDSLPLDGGSLVAQADDSSPSESPRSPSGNDARMDSRLVKTPPPQLLSVIESTPDTLGSDGSVPLSGVEGVAEEAQPFSPLSFYDNATKKRDAGSGPVGDEGVQARPRRRRRPGAGKDVLKSSEFMDAMGRKHECIQILRSADHSFSNGEFAESQRLYSRAVDLALARLQGRRLVPVDDVASPSQDKEADAAIGRSEALIIVRGISSILVRLGNAHFRQDDLDGARRAYRKAKKYLSQVIPRIDPSFTGSSKEKEVAEISNELEVMVSPSDESGAAFGTVVADKGSASKEKEVRLANTTQDQHPKISVNAPFELPPSLNLNHVTPKKILHEVQSVTPRSSYKSHSQSKDGNDVVMEGRILNNVASIDALRRRYKTATTGYAQSLRIKRRALRTLLQDGCEVDDESGFVSDDEKNISKDGTDEEAHRTSVLDIASTLHNIGLMRYELGKFSKAEDAYKQALSLRVEKCGLDDMRVSRTLAGLGDLYLAEGRYEHALRSYGEVLRIRRSVLGQRHALVGDALHNLGLVHLKKGPYGAARVALADALRARRDVLGGSHIDVASTGHLLGLVLTATGELASAKAVLEDALRIRCKHLGKNSGHLAIWNTRQAIGEVSRREGQVGKALETFQSVLDGRAARLGKGHPSVAEAARFIGLARRDEGDYAAALEAFGEALRVQLKKLGEDSVEAAETRTYLCDTYIKAGMLSEAIEACQQSMLVLKTKLGQDHILYAKSLKCLGDLYQGQGRFDDALKAYHEVMRIRTSWEEASHIDVGDTWNNIGNALFKKGDFEEAKNAFAQALNIKKRWLDDESVSVFTTLNNLGHAYYKLRDLGLALKTYTESLKNQMARLSGEKKGEFLSQLRDIADRLEQIDSQDEYVRRTSNSLGNVAATLRNIGLVYQDQSKFTKALEVYERILTVRKAQPIVDHAAIAATAETIGMLHFKLGNHESAMGAFSESLNVKKSSQGEDTIDVARTLNNLANVYFSSGNLEQAMSMYEKSLKIKRDRLGDTHEEVANTLNNIAHVLFTSGQDNRSLEVYNQVLRIRREKFGRNNMSVASTLSTMGDVYLKKGTLNHAKTCFEESAVIRSQQSSRNLAEDARVYENLGVVHGKLGNWKSAENYFTESLKMKVSSLGQNHEEIPKTLDSLALALIEQGRFDDAIKPLEDALRIRKSSFSSIEEITALMTKIAFLQKKSGRPDLALQMYADIERLEATEGTGVVSEHYASF